MCPPPAGLARLASLRGLTPPFSIPATPREAVGARGVPPPAPLGSQETGVPPTGLPWEFGDSYLGGGGGTSVLPVAAAKQGQAGKAFLFGKRANEIPKDFGSLVSPLNT